jgi:hypothetical protein
MFKEKDCDGHEQPHWSMTRVVAFLAALTMNWALLTMSRKDHVHDIAWPFCVMYVVTLLAVPLQMMFKFLQVWFTSAPGKALLKSVLEKVQAHGITLGSASAPANTTVETKVTQGDPDK